MELVDEYEELELVLAHYALAWGSKIDKAKHPQLAGDYDPVGSGSGGLLGWGLQKETEDKDDRVDEEVGEA